MKARCITPEFYEYLSETGAEMPAYITISNGTLYIPSAVWTESSHCFSVVYYGFATYEDIKDTNLFAIDESTRDSDLFGYICYRCKKSSYNVKRPGKKLSLFQVRFSANNGKSVVELPPSVSYGRKASLNDKDPKQAITIASNICTVTQSLKRKEYSGKNWVDSGNIKNKKNKNKNKKRRLERTENDANNNNNNSNNNNSNNNTTTTTTTTQDEIEDLMSFTFFDTLPTKDTRVVPASDQYESHTISGNYPIRSDYTENTANCGTSTMNKEFNLSILTATTTTIATETATETATEDGVQYLSFDMGNDDAKQTLFSNDASSSAQTWSSIVEIIQNNELEHEYSSLFGIIREDSSLFEME